MGKNILGQSVHQTYLLNPARLNIENLVFIAPPLKFYYPTQFPDVPIFDGRERLYLPSRRFHRRVGEYAGHYFDIHGALISRSECEPRSSDWLPTLEDRELVRRLMKPVTEPGKIANWIATPKTGVNQRPFEYVLL